MSVLIQTTYQKVHLIYIIQRKSRRQSCRKLSCNNGTHSGVRWFAYDDGDGATNNKWYFISYNRFNQNTTGVTGGQLVTNGSQLQEQFMTHLMVVQTLIYQKLSKIS